MSRWPTVSLGELCSVTAGGTPARAVSSYFAGSIPWVKIGDMLQGEVSETEETITQSGLENSTAKLLPAGTVLISIFATIGRTAILGVDATTNQAIAGLTPYDPEILLPKYLRRYLDSTVEQLTSQARGVAQVNINSKILKEIEIPLPPPNAQRSVLEILDRSDELRAKRQQAITLLDDLARSIFLDMFGDPVSNMCRWPVAILGDLLSGITSGKSPTCLDRSAGDGEWGVLKLGAITKCVYQPSANKALPSNISPDERYEVHPGDVLFSRKNTRELVAASAFVEETPTKLLLPDLIFRFEIRKDAPLIPRYLHKLLIQPSQRGKIQDLASGSAASMLNISKNRLSRVEIPLPPADLQREFSERIIMIERLIKSHHADLWELGRLFESLQARAFRNEL